MNKAIFLDRDGVINELIYNSLRNEYEPPHNVKDLQISEFAVNTLQLFQTNGFKLFLISNQPDYAKGKTSLKNLIQIHNELHNILIYNKVYFSEYYYCYHHPNGIIPEFSYMCNCRKPDTFFTNKAISDYEIDPSQSWLIGDRETDIECGNRTNLRTIQIHSDPVIRGNDKADFKALNLHQASKIIFESN